MVFLARDSLGACSVSHMSDGRNIAEDVQNIQETFNKVEPNDGGPQPSLKVDGICGPRTTAAIRHFQMHHFGQRGADSRIGPDHQTLAKLNEILGSSATGPKSKVTTPAVPDKVIRAALSRHLATARSWIRSARFELTRALPVADGPMRQGLTPFDRSNLMFKINLHFELDKLSHRRDTLTRMLRVYDAVESVFLRAGGVWGEKAFEITHKVKANSHKRSFTSYGGFYHLGGRNITRVRPLGKTLFT
jgi:hypothetical protein